MTRGGRLVISGVIVLVVAAVLAYLHDPPWLARLTTGLGEVRRDERGVFYRWTGARASLFFPSDTAALEVPVRALFRTTDRSPFVVSFAVDGRPAGRVVLSDEAWVHAAVNLPASASRRRVRRLDIAVSRTWGDEGYGVMLGLTAAVPR